MPDFLIIGAQKAGTTSLYSYLSQHPLILRPAFKEAHFFDDDRNYGKLSQYALNFELPHKRLFTKKQTFEATPDYLYYVKCAKRIKSKLSGIKLVILLREPVSRAFSAWKMHHYHFKNHPRHSSLNDPRSFNDAVKQELRDLNNYNDQYSYLSRGLYARQLEEYFKFFSSDELLILDSKRLKSETQKVMNEVCEFTGLPLMDIEQINSSQMFWENKSEIDISLDGKMREKLLMFYERPNSELFKLIGSKLSWAQ